MVAAVRFSSWIGRYLIFYALLRRLSILTSTNARKYELGIDTGRTNETREWPGQIDLSCAGSGGVNK